MQAEISSTITTLAELLFQIAENFGERPALIKRSGLRDDVWSYARLNGVARNVARQLREDYRLPPGSLVLVQGFNDPQLVAVYLGCLVAGVIIVPLDQHSSPDFIDRIAASVEASAFIGSPASSQPPAIPQISLADLDWSERPEAALTFSPKPDDIAEIIFTSGTTGQSKGVILTHRNLLFSIKAIQDAYPSWQEVRFLSLLPLSHLFEQCVGLFAPLLHGATLFYPDGRHSSAILQKLVKKRIHGVVAVPQLLALLLGAIETSIICSKRKQLWRQWPQIGRILPFGWRRFFTDRLFPEAARLPMFFVCGGASLPLPVELHLEYLGIRVVQGYGATECAPVIATNSFDRRIQGSVGWPKPRLLVKLSEQGEILVKGDNVTQGYWKNEAATRAAFTQDHFYRTADLGEIGPHGELYIKGRCNNSIVLANGLNVFPEDIEPVVEAQPGVARCIVMALPDATGSDCITAVLRLTEETEAPQEQMNIARNAIRLANASLAPYQRIAAVRIWRGGFPLTPLLKIQRWKVRDALLNANHQSIHTANPVPAIGELATLEQLLATVCKIPLQSISENADLDLDLGLDSLDRVELAVLLEQRLGVHLDDADLIGIRRVGDLENLLKRSEKATAEERFPSWPLTGATGAARRLLQQTIAFPVHRLLSRSFTVTGSENLRDLALPALFIANHSSHVDTLSILRALPAPIRRKLAVAAASDYFFSNGLLAILLPLAINAFPFTREGSIRTSLEYCGELIDNGWSVLIYPEGTRSTSGRLLDFKPGIGFLATGLGVPIVPVAVSGGFQILPKGAVWPQRHEVHVHFGVPINIPSGTEKQDATSILYASLLQLIDEQRDEAAHSGLKP